MSDKKKKIIIARIGNIQILSMMVRMVVVVVVVVISILFGKNPNHHVSIPIQESQTLLKPWSWWLLPPPPSYNHYSSYFLGGGCHAWSMNRNVHRWRKTTTTSTTTTACSSSSSFFQTQSDTKPFQKQTSITKTMITTPRNETATTTTNTLDSNRQAIPIGSNRRSAIVAAVTMTTTSLAIPALADSHESDFKSNPFLTTAAMTSTDTSPTATTTATSSSSLSTPFQIIRDPETYSALFYSPITATASTTTSTTTTATTNPPPPLILVLHGAGKNNLNILEDLANPNGEHAGLIPSLIASSYSSSSVSSSSSSSSSSDTRTATTATATAPSILLQEFCVVAPYSQGKASFYEDPRSKLLQFVDFLCQNQDQNQNENENENENQQQQQNGRASLSFSSSSSSSFIPRFDSNRIILFGFSDGATVAAELLTTQRRRFNAAILCSYGYSGSSLPSIAVQRLARTPIWVFHSADDVIFNVQNSDRFVQQIQKEQERQEKIESIELLNQQQEQQQQQQQRLPTDMDGSSSSSSSSSSFSRNRIRYNRYLHDPEHLPPRVQGHSMGITASKLPEIYEWMLEQPPLLPS